MTNTTGHASFQVGDRVWLDFGGRKATGVITEVRGLLAPQGRRLFQVLIPVEPFEPLTIELPEDQLEAVPPGTDAGPVADKRKVSEYLVNGGLTSILRSNASGGKNQLRAWLCPDQVGNITHTFDPDWGVVGGRLVPSRAVRGDKVNRPKRDEVVAFVESFGLSRRDAEKVVAEVGTAGGTR